MDFDFTPDQQAFAKEVEAFLDANDDPDVFDVTRENMAQIVDTPKRRAFMKQLGRKGWLGITWPEEYGGSDGEGVYEYILNEQLAGRGGPLRVRRVVLPGERERVKLHASQVALDLLRRELVRALPSSAA